MSTNAVVKTGGKQYLVKVGSEIVVDKIQGDIGAKIDLVTLAIFSKDGELELGKPEISKKVNAEIIESGKGDKIRIAKFKAKVRYRNVRGFRPTLTRLKIISL